MAAADFDIQQLAEYLHLLPQQVSRMADRGKLPGRKVGGQWRFSRAEIHHWMEEKIGALDDDSDLAEMEDVLQRSDASAPAEGSLADMLAADHIALPLQAKTRNAVINAMVDLAAGTGLLWDPEKMADAVRAREDMQSTALTGGVALLHPRRPMSNILAEPFVALGITSTGVPFGDASGRLTDIFFLVASVSDSGHLQTLARLARLINDAAILDAVRDSADAASLHRLILDFESQLPTT